MGKGSEGEEDALYYLAKNVGCFGYEGGTLQTKARFVTLHTPVRGSCTFYRKDWRKTMTEVNLDKYTLEGLAKLQKAIATKMEDLISQDAQQLSSAA
jgi:hypothetical protein